MSDFSPEDDLSALTTAVAVDCPYCGESIELVVDLSVGHQSYIEDCHVCCQPIVVDYSTEGGALTAISVREENQ